MKLWLDINKVTKKRNWDKDKCNTCGYRFTCFAGNEIIVESDKLDINKGHFVALFSVPSCIRVGIFKQMSDNWDFGSFKYGKLLDTEFRISYANVTLKPPTIRLYGTKW